MTTVETEPLVSVPDSPGDELVTARAKKLGLALRDTEAGTLYLLVPGEPDANGKVIYSRQTLVEGAAPRIVAYELREDDDSEWSVSGYVIRDEHKPKRPELHVSLDSYPAGRWLSRWPGAMTSTAGATAREKMSLALLRLAREKDHPDELRIVDSIGWDHAADGAPIYRHAGGAIGPDGPVSIVIDPKRHGLSSYGLPAPSDDAQAVEALRASLALFDLAPEGVGAVELGAVYRAPLGSSRLTAWIYGPTGNGKSEITLIFQSHSGAMFARSRKFPGNWSSTENTNRDKLHAAKDALVTYDDWMQDTSTSPTAARHLAAAVVEAQFNGTGRGRQRSTKDAGVIDVEGKAPRGTLNVSAEETPPIAPSRRNRAFTVPFPEGCLDLKGPGSKRLAAAQRLSRKGVYALALSTFVQHLAQHYDAIGLDRDLLDDEAWESDDGWRDTEQARLRDSAPLKARGHTATLLGELGTGWEALLTVAVDRGALTKVEAFDYWCRAWADLYRAAERQSDALLLSGPAARMLDYLGAALAAGRCHLAGAKGEPPDGDDSECWGWTITGEKHDASGNGSGEHYWQARGERIGYLTADVVYLLAVPALSMAKRLAGEAGEDLNVSETSVTDRLTTDKYLAGADGDHQRAKVPYTVDHDRPRSWAILRDRLTIWSFGGVGQVGQLGQQASEADELSKIIVPDLHFYTDPVSPDGCPTTSPGTNNSGGQWDNDGTAPDLRERTDNDPDWPVVPLVPPLCDVNMIGAPDPYETGPLSAYFGWLNELIDADEAKGEPVDWLALTADDTATLAGQVTRNLAELVSLKREIEDPDAPRWAPLALPHDPTDPAAIETAAAWDRLQAERKAREALARGDVPELSAELLDRPTLGAFPVPAIAPGPVEDPATAPLVPAEAAEATAAPTRTRKAPASRGTRQGAPSTEPEASTLDAPADMAVLDGAGLAFTDGRAVAGLPSSAAELARLVLDGGADRVAILPDAIEALGWPARLAGSEPYSAPAIVTPWAETVDGYRCTPARDKGEPGTVWRTVRIVPEGRGPSVVAMVPSWDDFGALSECRDRKSALAFLARFGKAVGYPWRGLVAETTGGLIRATHPIEHRGAQVHRGDDMPPPASNDLETALVYCRTFTDTDLKARYLHVEDVRAQYLAPLGSLSFGRGDVIHHPEGLAYRKGAPALYRLVEALPADLGDGLPVPWGRGPWYMGETFERAVELVELPPVVEAYTWPDNGRYLKGFYEHLRDAYKILDGSTAPGAREALAAVKACYRIQVGRLGAAHLAESKAALYRPPWRLAVVAKSRGNLDRHLRALDVRPVAVATDGAYFVTDEPDARTFGESLGLPMTNKLGHFKPGGSCKLTPKLAAELSAFAGYPGRFIKRVKRELEK